MHSMTLNELVALIARASWHAAVVVALILFVQWTLRKQLSAAMRYTLWFVLLARLSLPSLPQSPWSLFNLTRVGPALHQPGVAVPAPPVSVGASRLHSSGQPQRVMGSVAGHVRFAAAPSRTAGEGGARTTQTSSLVAANPESIDPFTPSTSRPPLSLSFVLSWIWLAGAACLALRFAWQNVTFALKLRGARRLKEAAVRLNLEACARSIGLRRVPAVLETTAVGSPALYGLWQPCLLLPVGLVETLSLAELRFVFLHELAHLKRRDLAVNWLVAVFEVLHWFNPVLWLAFSRMRADREVACDALALSRAGEGENRAYGETLLKILSGASRPAVAAGLVGIGEDMRQMKVRMRMIRQFGNTSSRRLVPLVAGLALAAATLTDAQVGAPAPSQRAETAPAAGTPVPVSPAAPGKTVPERPGDSDRPLNSPESTLLTDARLLIEMGKLDEAEKKLLEIMRQSPEDRNAHYYLSLVKEARFAQGARKRDITPTLLNGEKSSNTPVNREKPSNRTASGRQLISQKLDEIVLPEVHYEGITLSEVVRDLNEQARRRDPAKRGVNFIINPAEALPPTQPAGGIDPVTGQPVPAPPQARFSLNDVIIRLRLHDARLLDVIDAVTKVTEAPVRYSIEDYAVVFTHGTGPQALFTRTYRVDPKFFLEALRAVTPTPGDAAAATEDPVDISKGQVAGPGDLADGTLGVSGWDLTTSNRGVIEQIRRFFTAAGVDFSNDAVVVGGSGVPQASGKALFFNDRTGLLLARATTEELDVIEKAIQVLNTAPPQLAIAATLIELTGDTKQLGFDWLLGTIPSRPEEGQERQQAPESGEQGGVIPNGSPATQAASAKTTASGILTDPQTRVFLHALEQRGGTKTLANPTVTTLTGRQIRTEIPSAGFSLDLIPFVMADGYTVHLHVDFQLGAVAREENDGTEESKPLHVSTSARVWDGATLLLGPFSVGGKDSDRRVLLLIKPTLVDPAGNRIHADGGQPYQPK